MNPDEKARQRIKFERNFVVLPYIIFAIIVFIFTTIFAQPTVVLTLFGIFLIYNAVLLFVAFIKHYHRTMILLLILTIFVGLIFGISATAHFSARYN
ncbi:hypothetical protein [Staphylococcus carnosus]|uniref:Membrane protein n=2 Tax=Staphylococcus carnosus TaxID=1281 RepID=B9DK65_STACT|nr:hypothetical protein [Staphylococcus carnosus]ANZ34031.1 hypothetical protein BEK99_09645 [Staphylococcus carnosus]KKB25090.1 hypothetical protein VV61_08430 [Staphylococcus carnosus]KOR14218.1 hypothetical protein AMC75_04955 [Staphylococcus carnosus]POA02112.1 hypothetical protein CD153_07050 [Staphylococcus carnosus]QPT03434.1 hypothetical protein I6G40_10135 [Staphylococcus carnosus]